MNALPLPLMLPKSYALSQRLAWTLVCLAGLGLAAAPSAAAADRPAARWPSPVAITKEWTGKSLGEVRRAAEQGQMTAQHFLGFSYGTGTNGVKVDYAEALRWFQKAAAQGYPMSQYDLGQMHAWGLGVPKDDVKAAGLYRKAAEQGCPEAQCALGEFYEQGRGVERDYTLAQELYLKSADQGWAQAQVYVGWYRTQIIEDYTNCVSGVAYLTKAVAQGHPAAMHLLGDCYLEGKGVEQDEVRALELVRRSADLGHQCALLRLGEYYASGIGEPRSSAELPFNLMQRAAELGERAAYEGLLMRYTNGYAAPLNFIEAARWYCHAAEDQRGRFEMVDDLLHDALGTHEQIKREPFLGALQLYIKAARTGDTESPVKIGEMFLAGRDVPQDPAAAWAWFNLAAGRGSSAAASRRARIEQDLDAAQLQRARRLAGVLVKELEAAIRIFR